MLRARDIMQTHVATASPGLSLTQLEQLLEREGISGMPVEEDGEVCGVVSRADIVRRFANDAGSAEATLAYYHEIAGAAPGPTAAARMASEHVAATVVRDIMATELIAVSGNQPVREVAQVLIARKVHRLLVMEGRRLLGLISTVDLVRAIADGQVGGAPPR